MRKGMEGVQVVIGLVVAIVVALAIIAFTVNNVKNTEAKSTGSIDQAGNSIKTSLCQLKCSQCKEQNDGTCTGWNAFRPDEGAKNSCSNIMGCS